VTTKHAPHAHDRTPIRDIRATVALVGDYGVADLAAVLHDIDTRDLAPMHAAYRDLAREVDSFLAQPLRVQQTYNARQDVGRRMIAVQYATQFGDVQRLRDTVRFYTDDVLNGRTRLFHDVGDLAATRPDGVAADAVVPAMEYADALANALARRVDAVLVCKMFAETESAYLALMQWANRITTPCSTGEVADLAQGVAADIATRRQRNADSVRLTVQYAARLGVESTMRGHFECGVIDGYDLADALARIDTATAAEPYYRLTNGDLADLAREVRARTVYTRWR